MHTLDILWVCKRSFLHTLTQLVFSLQMQSLPAHNPKGCHQNVVRLSPRDVKKVWRAPQLPTGITPGLAERHGAYRVTGNGLLNHRMQGDSESVGRLRSLEWRGCLKNRNMPRGQEGPSSIEGRLACLEGCLMESNLETARRPKARGASGPGDGRVIQHM